MTLPHQAWIAKFFGKSLVGTGLFTAIAKGLLAVSVPVAANATRTSQAGTSTNYLYTCFDYDDLNRLLAHRTKRFVAAHGGHWDWDKRSHVYDALGRLVKSTYKQWQDGDPEPGGDSLEYVYDKGGQHVQNYDGTSTYGAVWHWAGAQQRQQAMAL